MGRMPSIGSGCVLIIRLRTRLAARGIRNRAVTRNIVRRILIAAPARCAHLMPEEGSDSDDECGAHEKRRRQYGQILTRRTHPLQPAAIFARPGGGRGQAPPARDQGPPQTSRDPDAAKVICLRAQASPAGAADHRPAVAADPAAELPHKHCGRQRRARRRRPALGEGAAGNDSERTGLCWPGRRRDVASSWQYQIGQEARR